MQRKVLDLSVKTFYPRHAWSMCGIANVMLIEIKQKNTSITLRQYTKMFLFHSSLSVVLKRFLMFWTFIKSTGSVYSLEVGILCWLDHLTLAIKKKSCSF